MNSLVWVVLAVWAVLKVADWATSRRRSLPKGRPDPALTTAACPACGGEFVRWGDTRWSEEARQFEQRRACKECGYGQRRRVRNLG